MEPRPPLVSMIIPVWKDDRRLAELLRQHAATPDFEWIVAAAEPSAGLEEMAASHGARLTVTATPSRGRQMNDGADIAVGRLLCFHHADTLLDEGHLRSLAAAASDAAIQGGAFYRELDDRHAWAKPFEWVVRGWDRKIGALMGDQSIFVRRELFEAMNGYADIPLMEDIEFSKRFRREHKITLLDPPLLSSPRRSTELGSWKTTALNLSFLSLYHIGVSPHRLHGWYYRRRKRQVDPP